MTATAIFFHSDAIEGEGKDLVGRRSAGQSFLRGYLDHVPGDTVHAVTQHKKAAGDFEKLCRAWGETRAVDVAPLRGSGGFSKKGAIFFPGPGYLDAPWRRQRFGPATCSLIGITHTMSTRRVMEGLHRLMLEPVEDWDAIICTSRAVHSVVAQQLELEAEFIRKRFGAARVPMPQLPIIPLGIQAGDFRQGATQRAAMRKRFGAPDDAVVVMTMGRITSVEKANPVPLFLALEEVAKTAGKPVHLWMVGWSSRDAETALHKSGAKELAPSVKVTLVDGRDTEVRRHVWGGADIFTLPVDNIQETFGLVPVEAMAAGLPVVMPDWNGFRDTIVHGETGFLIPTRMPDAGQITGERLAERFADGTDDYLRFLSLVQQQTQLDVRAYAQALGALVTDADLRSEMGQAGQMHVRRNFDWSAVIPQYLDLAQELAALREGSTPTTPALRKGAINPLEVDPFALYGGYPSHRLSDDDVVTSLKALDASALTALDAVNGRALYGRKVMPDAQILDLSDLIRANAPLTIQALQGLTPLPKEQLQAGLLFLAKYDLVAIASQKPK